MSHLVSLKSSLLIPEICNNGYVRGFLQRLNMLIWAVFLIITYGNYDVTITDKKEKYLLFRHHSTHIEEYRMNTFYVTFAVHYQLYFIIS